MGRREKKNFKSSKFHLAIRNQRWNFPDASIIYITSAHILLLIIIYPLTAMVVGAPRMISQPVTSIYPCSPLPSGTCWFLLGLSITWCFLPTSSSVCLVFFPLSLCLHTLKTYFDGQTGAALLTKRGGRKRARCFPPPSPVFSFFHRIAASTLFFSIL